MSSNEMESSSHQWQDDDLDKLPMEDTVRLRGLHASRLDTFMDATFAFVLTLLVISFDELPSNYEEMIITIKRIPAFLVCFSILMSFWLSHRRWSRRYGVESSYSVFLSLTLMFVVLVYVYPLRMMFELMFHEVSGGFLTADFQLETRAELRGMFIYYSIGSFTMALIFFELHRLILKQKEQLVLNTNELIETKGSAMEWAVVACYSLSSIILAITLSDRLIPLAGYVYIFIYPTMLVMYRVIRRGRTLA